MAGGRPRVGPTIQIRLPADLLARVDRLAADTNSSRAATIRRLIVAALPAAEHDEAPRP